jgi:hypothetical protein
MGVRIHSCPNLEFAKGFIAGVELANDSALRVTECFMLVTGEFVVFLEDADYEGEDAFASTSGDPVRISLEVLRGG